MDINHREPFRAPINRYASLSSVSSDGFRKWFEMVSFLIAQVRRSYLNKVGSIRDSDLFKGQKAFGNCFLD